MHDSRYLISVHHEDEPTQFSKYSFHCNGRSWSVNWGGGGGGVYSYIRVMPDGFLFKSVFFS